MPGHDRWWSSPRWVASGPMMFAYMDPMQSTFQRNRETKAWWVCPRNPFVEGFKCDVAPFFDETIRSWHQSPGRMLRIASGFGIIAGLMSVWKDGLTMMTGSQVGIGPAEGQALSDGNAMYRTNWNIRVNHAWAVRRLWILRFLRPVMGANFLWAVYCVPRELYSQNFGRRNRRYYWDTSSAVIGSTIAMWCFRPIFGTIWARTFFMWTYAMVFSTDWLYCMGGAELQFKREWHWPTMLINELGPPDGGEGYDVYAQGEHGVEWKMESDVMAPWFFACEGKKVRNPQHMEHHPYFRYDWGHFHWDK